MAIPQDMICNLIQRFCSVSIDKGKIIPIVGIGLGGVCGDLQRASLRREPCRGRAGHPQPPSPTLRGQRFFEKRDEAMDRKIAIELADWLAHMRKVNEDSVCRNDPVIRAHIAKLKLWEKMVRELPDELERLETMESAGEDHRGD
jgi:hypothetical protein